MCVTLPPTAQGWFCLARARYQLGPNAVGALQYDSNMAACVRLTRSRDEEVEAEGAGAPAAVAWSLRRVDDGDETGHATLRRRGAVAGAARGPAPPPVAPLRWFAGALPPPSLRAAQQHFCRALESAVEAANAAALLASLEMPQQQHAEVEEDAVAGVEGGAQQQRDNDEGGGGVGGGEEEFLAAAVDAKLRLSGEDDAKGDDDGLAESGDASTDAPAASTVSAASPL